MILIHHTIKGYENHIGKFKKKREEFKVISRKYLNDY